MCIRDSQSPVLQSAIRAILGCWRSKAQQWPRCGTVRVVQSLLVAALLTGILRPRGCMGSDKWALARPTAVN
eukprot:8761482-Alexandrium_andersonii.AAC.1